MTLQFAIDCSSWTGELTVQQAQSIKDMGYSKAIVNLWGGKTCRSQIDAFQAVGMEVDGYIYFYFNQNPEWRIDALMQNLEGRIINFLWLDWEDDETVLSVPDTIDYIARAVKYCEGKVFTGHYTRREWWIRRTQDTQMFAGMWLWDATNDRTADMSYNPYGGFRHYMEQFAFDVPLLGTAAGNFDLNVYDDAVHSLPEAPPVEPEPVPPTTPVAPEVTVRYTGYDSQYGTFTYDLRVADRQER